MAPQPKKVPENFNALYDAGARAARGGPAVRAAAVPRTGMKRLTKDVAELTVHYDEVTQLPVSIAVSHPQRRLSARADSPAEAAVEFVRARADLWNLSQADAATVVVHSVSAQGLPTVRLIQRIREVEVFNAELRAALAPDNSVVSVSGHLFHGASSARAAKKTRGGLSAQAAIAKAAFDLTGAAYAASDFSSTKSPTPIPRHTKPAPIRIVSLFTEWPESSLSSPLNNTHQPRGRSGPGRSSGYTPDYRGTLSSSTENIPDLPARA